MRDMTDQGAEQSILRPPVAAPGPDLPKLSPADLPAAGPEPGAGVEASPALDVQWRGEPPGDPTETSSPRV